jgi:nucleoid-associated protein EbfC
VSDEHTYDFSAMLRQAQGLQEKLKQLQLEAAEKTVDAQSGGGMVRVVVDGAMRVRKVEIDPAIAAAGDKAMMEDLIVVAVNDGLRRAQEMVAQEMSKLGPLAGMNLPGILGGSRG